MTPESARSTAVTSVEVLWSQDCPHTPDGKNEPAHTQHQRGQGLSQHG